jgi:DNA-binding CsgD family transcriptional regulator
MPSGIRATVEFTGHDVCPVVNISVAAETTVHSQTANVCPSGCSESVTEFTLEADRAPEGDLTPIFSRGSTHRYRLPHDGEANCPCECLGEIGCPVTRYVAREGTLTVVFHAADYDQLQAAIGELRERFPEVNVKRFVRSPADGQPRDTVSVNRSKLTARQLEVVETAYERGYFERPRRANATEIAADLGINPSTFREHLTAAESKILGDVL